MNTSISDFLKEQTCASICVVDAAGKPYCFSCFYVFDPAEGLLCFKSSIDTYHMQLIKNNPNIAGTVLPDKLNKVMIKGIQFEGCVLSIQHHLAGNGCKLYVKKYPMSLAIPGKVWAIQVNMVKLTDSSKVFGKKTIWNRAELVV